MPAPIPFANRPAFTQGAVAPPPPPPGFFDGLFDPKVLGANVDVARDDIPGHIEEERYGAYTSVMAALLEKGMSAGRYQQANPASEYDPGALPIIDYDTVVADAHRLGVAGVPATREAFDLQWQQQMLQRQQRTQRTAAQGGLAARLAGGMTGAMTDPLNVATLPFGGFGKALLTMLLTEGVVQAGIQGAELPFVNIERGRQGRPAMSGAEEAMSIGTGFLGGVAFRGVAEAPGALRGGFEHAVATHWDKLPQGLRDRWTARTELPPHDQDALMADLSESIIGRDNMTGAEAAAADFIRRGAQVEAASPFAANGRAADLHPQLLAEAMRHVLDQVPEAPRRAPTVFDGTAISSRTVQPGDLAPDAQIAFMSRVRHAESGGIDARSNPRSTAAGRYQFTDGTWLAYYKRRFGSDGLSDAQILARKGDGTLQDRLMADLTADNAAFLRRRGEAVTEGNLYLVHFAGQGGAAKLLEADPSVRVETVLGEKVVEANPFLRGKTAGETVAWASRVMGQPEPPRAGARAAVRDDAAGSAAERQRLQDEIDKITGQMDQLARERGHSEVDAVTGEAAAPEPRSDLAAAPEPVRAPIEDAALQARDHEAPNEPSFTEDLRKIVADKGRSLNDMEGLARDLNTTPEQVRGALELLVGTGEVTKRSDTGTFMRKPPAPARGARSLLEFIADRGGLDDAQGEIAHMGGEHWHREAPFRRKLIRAADTGQRSMLPGGYHEHSADDLFARAIEAGYFPELQGEVEAGGKPDLSHFFQAVRDELHGKPRHPLDMMASAKGYDRLPGETPAAPEYVPDEGYADLVANMRVMMPEARDEAPEVLEYAAQMAIEHGMELEEALSRAVNDYADATRELAVEEHPDAGYEDLDYGWPFDTEPGGENLAARGDRPGPESVRGDAEAGGPERADAEEAARAGYAEGQRLAEIPPEQRTPQLDPDSAANKAQADSLLHDLRAAVDAARAAGKKSINQGRKGPYPSESDARLNLQREHEYVLHDAERGNWWVIGTDAPASPSLDRGEAVDPNVAALEKQRGQLGADAPLRPATEQESTLGFGLFGAADGVRLDENGEARPLKDLLDDLDREAREIKDIRDCL